MCICVTHGLVCLRVRLCVCRDISAATTVTAWKIFCVGSPLNARTLPRYHWSFRTVVFVYWFACMLLWLYPVVLCKRTIGHPRILSYCSVGYWFGGILLLCPPHSSFVLFVWYPSRVLLWLYHLFFVCPRYRAHRQERLSILSFIKLNGGSHCSRNVVLKVRRQCLWCDPMQAMVFCITHADAAAEIVDCVAESLQILETPIHTKVGTCGRFPSCLGFFLLCLRRFPNCLGLFTIYMKSRKACIASCLDALVGWLGLSSLLCRHCYRTKMFLFRIGFVDFQMQCN